MLIHDNFVLEGLQYFRAYVSLKPFLIHTWSLYKNYKNCEYILDYWWFLTQPAISGASWAELSHLANYGI